MFSPFPVLPPKLYGSIIFATWNPAIPGISWRNWQESGDILKLKYGKYSTGDVYNILIRRDVYQRIYHNERNFHKIKTYQFLTKFAE